MPNKDLEHQKLIESSKLLIIESQKKAARLREVIQADKEILKRLNEGIAKMKSDLEKLKAT